MIEYNANPVPLAIAGAWLRNAPDFTVAMRIAMPDRHQKTRTQENMISPIDLISRKMAVCNT